MTRPGNVLRFNLGQLAEEDRKQRAHLKKIDDMKRASQLDHHSPTRFPHIHRGFVRQLEDKQNEISKENLVQSKRIIDIMASKREHLPETPPTKIPTRRTNTMRNEHNHGEYLERIAKVKGKYDAQEWKKSFDHHKEYLRLNKDKNVFTPLDLGANRQRLKVLSVNPSKRTTPFSSRLNLFQPTKSPA